MKLYYSKGACSLAPHIVLEELGLPYEAVAVDIRKDPSPEYLKINPMGAVPVLELDSGQVLTEAAVILQYLGDLKPEAGLVPALGTLPRYHCMEWLNFIATEIHKGFGPLFYADLMAQNPEARAEIRKFGTAELEHRFDVIVGKLGSQEYLMPDGFTVADAYLFTVMGWTQGFKMSLDRWPSLMSYLERVKARPAVLRTLKAEHLVR
jgi:glutathione S-transferase